MNFVNIELYKKVKRIALHEGIAPRMLAHHEATLNQFRDKQFIPLDLLLELYEITYDNLESGFTLRVGQNMVPEDYGTLGLSWKTCWKVRDIFERLSRYIILITNKGIFELKDIGSQSQFLLDRPIHRIGQALSNEATFAMCIQILKLVTNMDIIPHKVSFRHTALSNHKLYNKYFKCPVEFEQKLNAIWFSTKDLEIKTTLADKSISNFLIERMKEEKKGIEKNTKTLASDVEVLIKDALPSGIPSINDVSKILGMSNRTLTRRLSDYGVSFRELIKKTQESISKDLLQNTGLSVGEIAFQTGFSEQSAFNRAFKRWTSLSPLEFRKM